MPSNYQAKLKRLEHQLSLTENLLQTHPLVSERLTILQTILHYFTKQAEWSAAGPLSRLSMTFHTALCAQETRQSQSGFMGPALMRLQKGLASLMQTLLSPTDKKLTDLLVSFTQTMAIAVIYLLTQTLGNWKKVFPPDDPGAAKAAGLLLRELGIAFALGSRLLETPFLALGHQLNLDEKRQKRLSHIGLGYLLILVLLVNEEDQPNNEELFELIQRFMDPTLGDIEEIIQEAQNQGVIEREYASTALSQLQLIRRAIDSSDAASLKLALLSSFDALELPYGEVKKDLITLIALCRQVNESFKNIFYQSELSMTSMTQSA